MNWTTEILGYLLENSGPTSVAFSEEFVKKLIDNPSDLAGARQIEVVLKDLEDARFITWSVYKWELRLDTSPHHQFYSEDHYKGRLGYNQYDGWALSDFDYSFTSCRVVGRLTVDGLLKAMQLADAQMAREQIRSTLDFNRSAIDLNAEIKRHNKVTVWATVAIFLATMAQAGIAYLSYQQSQDPQSIEIKPDITIEEVRADSVHIIYVKPDPASKENEKKPK